MMRLLSPFQGAKIILKGISDDTIYHYTSLLAFRKIIESGVFHLTHYRELHKLRDDKELTWAFDYYIKTISKLFPPNFNFEELLPDEYYIFCTCKRRDNRFLWENYASSNDRYCSGIVLGINAAAIYQHYSVNSHFIDMTPMDYNPEKFMRLCDESFEGLFPVSVNVVSMPDDHTNWTRDKQQEYLHRIPGYKEFIIKREVPAGELMMQKGREFLFEEEVRILNWPEIHKRLPKMATEAGEKTILPWKLNNGHFISEIIRTDNCKWDEKRISRYLRRCGIQTKVTTLQLDRIIS